MFPNGPVGSLVGMVVLWRVLRLNPATRRIATHWTVQPGGGPVQPRDATTRAVDGPAHMTES